MVNDVNNSQTPQNRLKKTTKLYSKTKFEDFVREFFTVSGTYKISVMEETPAAQLIAVCLEYPEFNQLLSDIRDFDWKVINKLRREDLARISSTGFVFKTKGIESQKKEVQSFLLNNPACMASDFELIMGKLQIFSHMVGAKRAEQQKPKEVPQITREKKKTKKKIIVVEDEEEDGLIPYTSSEDEESEGESEEEQRQRSPGRCTKKVWY